MNFDVKEIVRNFLIETEIDGLCSDYCGCSVDDLFPCDCQEGHCRPAKKKMCDGVHCDDCGYSDCDGYKPGESFLFVDALLLLPEKLELERRK
jgi:hypothetical protein